MTSPAPSERRAQVSTRAIFFLTGFGVSAWAPLVPFAKGRLGLDERALGLLLLCAGAGSVLTMPFSGALVARLGCRRIIRATALAMCAALPGLATAGSVPLLAGSLVLFGAGMGTLDVAMNVQAVVVEKASGRAMMSGFHGLYSVGSVAGAGFMIALLWVGATPLAVTLAAAGVILALLGFSDRHLLAAGSGGETGRTPFLWPRGVVLVLGVLCFIAFMGEGSVLDWSAVFLTGSRGVDPARAGIGYAVFATAMTLGRLLGDHATQAVGGRAMLAGGGLGAAAGLGLMVVVRSETAALAGFALVGLGAANVVPVLFTQTGRQTVMPSHLALPVVTTVGYAGLLAGPASIGLIAHAASLPVAFLMIAALWLTVAACSGVAGRKVRESRIQASNKVQGRRIEG